MNARSLLLTLVALSLAGGSFFGAEPASDVTPVVPPLPDRAETKTARTEEGEDHVVATACFVQARLAQQRGDLSAALAKYERAWRYDPRNSAVLAEIVSLANQLDRSQEAKRYAITAVESNPSDQILVRRLAILLSKEDEYERAAKLFERALELSGDKGDPPDDLSHAYLLLELGRLHVKAKNPVRGAEILLRLRKSLIDPEKTGLGKDNVEVVLDEADHTWELLGETFLLADRLDDAEDAYRRANESKENAAKLHFNLAKVAAARKKTDDGIAELDKAFEAKFGELGEEPFQLLEKLWQLKESDAAAARKAVRERLAKLNADHPKEAELALYYAKVLREEPADLPHSRKLYEGVLEKHPSVEAFEALAAVLIAQQDAPALAKLLGDVITKTGSLAAISDTELVLTGKEQQALLEKLIAHVTAEVEARPADAPAGESFAAGLLALAIKDRARGTKLLEHAAEHSSRKSQVYLQWGASMLAANDSAAAAEVFQKMLDKDAAPRSAGVGHYYLAGALELAGKTDEALAVIEKAEKASADNPLFVHRRAWILYHAKQNDSAEAAYRALIASCEKLRRTEALRELVIEAKLVMSNLVAKRNDRKAAVEWLEQVLDEDPEHVGALNDLSYLWSERGEHLHRSLSMAQRAVETEPDNAAYRDTLGWAYYQLGQFPSAEKELAAAAKEAPDGVILEHWADALDKLGRRDDARATWQKAAAAFEAEKDKARAESVKKKLETSATAP